jgi:hypothetical protein
VLIASARLNPAISEIVNTGIRRHECAHEGATSAR